MTRSLNGRDTVQCVEAQVRGRVLGNLVSVTQRAGARARVDAPWQLERLAGSQRRQLAMESSIAIAERRSQGNVCAPLSLS